MVVVLLIAGAVIGGVLYSNAQKNKTEGVEIPVKLVAADYAVRRDGAVIVAGKDDAKATVDIYVDMLCPFCRQFEEKYAPALSANLTGGSLKVRYHLVTILNNQSDPPGYSLDSANATLCAADGGRFPAYLASLFAAQPEEGARGYSKDQLASLGTRLAVNTPDFSSCVTSNRYAPDIQSADREATTTPHLQRDIRGQRIFSTPTIAVGQTLVDTTDPNWLNKLVNP